MQNNDDLQTVWNNGAPRKLTVGGEHFDPHNASDEDILFTIKALPGNLSDRARISTDISYSPVPPADTHELAAYAASNAYGEHGDFDQLQISIDEYIAAAEQYEAMGQLKPAANMYSLAAQSYNKYPFNTFEDDQYLTEKAIKLYDKAIQLHDLQGHEDFSYRDRDKRYNAIAETVLAYREYATDDITEEQKHLREAHYYNRLRPEAAQLLHCSRRIQGELDNTALRVEQKEIGISDGKSIGTDNVSQCVTLIIRSTNPNDPAQLPVVALAHIDYETDAQTISQMFDNLPDGHKEARILGARFDQDIKSVENLVKVVKALAAYEVDVISSNVYQGDQGPSTVIVNPYDFSMRESVPTADKGMAEASCAYSLITEDQTYPLRLAFDTREGEDRAPLYLTQAMVHKIRENHLGKDDVERYKAIRDEGLFDIGLSSYFFNSLVKQYEKSIEDILPFASAQLPQDVIEEMPLYIGKDAIGKNIALVEEISHTLRNGGTINKIDYDID